MMADPLLIKTDIFQTKILHLREHLNVISLKINRALSCLYFQVSETENLRKNLAVERMIVEGCDILLDVNQVFVRQGNLSC